MPYLIALFISILALSSLDIIDWIYNKKSKSRACDNKQCPYQAYGLCTSKSEYKTCTKNHTHTMTKNGHGIK